MKAGTLAEALGVEGTLVMPDAEAAKYTLERKLADPGKQPELFRQQMECTRGVVIHNAKTTQEVQDLLIREAKLQVVEYRPPKSTEAHFFVPATGHIHVVNSRGITRLMRDEALAKVLRHVLPQDIMIDISNYQHHRRRANDRFELFAFNLVDDIFTHLDQRAVREIVTSTGRLNLLFGPHASLDDAVKSEGCEVVHSAVNDYLNYRIFTLMAGNKPELVINFDYIFADQAKDVLHKLYKGVAAEFSRRGIDINVLHYGKVGILDPAAQVGEIVVPTGAIDEEKIQAARARGELVPAHYPLKNELASNPEVRRIFYASNGGRIHTGLTVNTNSVLEQTAEGLRTDLSAGGLSLDMEWIVMASLDAGSESTYPHIGTIRYFFAGVGSDKPLEGETLGNTEYRRQVEQGVAASLLRIVRHAPEIYGSNHANKR